MENDSQNVTSYDFLLDDKIEKHFADINIMLLSGRHIDERYYTAFSILEEKASQWTQFYKNLYNLNLIDDKFDSHRYFYLDFFDTAKGKFTDNSRHRELSETQTLVGLMLLDIYHKRYFDEQKMISWTDLKNIIIEGEQQEAYKRILFNEARESYDAREWGYVTKKINSAVDLFDKLGWVEKRSSSQGEVSVPDFEIRPAINRLAKLYGYELQNFESFASSLKKEED